VIALASCYFAAGLFTARKLYPRWRGMRVGRRTCKAHGTPDYREAHYSPPRCCYDEAAASDGEAALWAILAGLAWWAVALAAIVRWQPSAKPRLRFWRRRLTDAELAKIEREVGVGGK
jgi:hypothetical protein